MTHSGWSEATGARGAFEKSERNGDSGEKLKHKKLHKNTQRTRRAFLHENRWVFWTPSAVVASNNNSNSIRPMRKKIGEKGRRKNCKSTNNEKSYWWSRRRQKKVLALPNNTVVGVGCGVASVGGGEKKKKLVLLLFPISPKAFFSRPSMHITKPGGKKAHHHKCYCK